MAEKLAPLFKSKSFSEFVARFEKMSQKLNELIEADKLFDASDGDFVRSASEVMNLENYKADG